MQTNIITPAAFHRPMLTGNEPHTLSALESIRTITNAVQLATLEVTRMIAEESATTRDESTMFTLRKLRRALCDIHDSNVTAVLTHYEENFHV